MEKQTTTTTLDIIVTLNRSKTTTILVPLMAGILSVCYTLCESLCLIDIINSTIVFSMPNEIQPYCPQSAFVGQNLLIAHFL